MGLVSIWLTHFTCLSIVSDNDIGYWIFFWVFVSQPCSLVWFIGFFMLKYFFLLISLVEYLLLCAPNVRMLYLFAYHGFDNLSQWQLLVVLSSYVFVYHHHFATPIIVCSYVLLVVWLGLQYLQFVFKYWDFVYTESCWHFSCMVLLFGSLLWACSLVDVSSIFQG